MLRVTPTANSLMTAKLKSYQTLTRDRKAMTGEVTLITYSEIALKSTPVRRVLEHQLAHHIATSLKREGIDAKVRRIQGRLIAEGGNPTVVAETASKVFGVTSASPAIRVTSDIDTVVQAASDIALQTIKDGQTFAIRARRVGEQGYTSRDIQVKTGAEILERLKPQGVKVNLDNPDVTIHVEARNGDAYIYHRAVEGPSGLPYGSQGKLVSLFSGGIDSPVAAWFMMKRGANVRLLFLDQRPFVGDDYYERSLVVAKKLRRYVPLKGYILYIAPAGKIMEEIANRVPARLTCVVCKRMMYRVACSLAEKIGADGIVTGENLGQVASQTLRNLKVLDEASTLPVYRPLIGFEKMEIVAWARKIGTYEASTASIHGCSAVPAKPATKAKLADVLNAEGNLSSDRLASAIEGIARIKL